MATSPLVTAGDLSALSNFPAMLPPHGQSINFDNPVSRGETYTAVTTTLIVLMVLFVANRGYTKHFITRKLGWDDLTCSLAALMAVCYYIDCLYEVKKSKVGIHQWNVRVGDLASDHFLVPTYVGIVLVSPTLLFAKLTFFLMYLQLFRPMVWLRVCVYVGALVTTLFYVAATIVQLYFSTPRLGQTFLAFSQSPTELRSLVLSVPISAIGLAIDIYLLILPITAVMQLQLPTRRKIGVIMIFLTGLAACVASALSVYYRTLLNNGPDITWNLLPVNILTIAEMSVGITCACMPSMSKMVGHHLPAYKKLKSRLHFQFNSFKSTMIYNRLNKSSWSESGSSYNKSDLPYSQDTYAKIETHEAHDQGLLPPTFPTVSYQSAPMKNGVRTFIGGGKNNLIGNDGIHCTVKLQQHSEQYGGP